MMGLGDFRFSVKTATYNQLQRRTALRWAKNEPFGGRAETTIFRARRR